MLRSLHPSAIGDVVRVINGAAEVRRTLLAWRDARRVYAETHGGHDGWQRPDLLTQIPEPLVDPETGRRTVVEMGGITRIAYLADKGRGLEEHVHDFSRPYPILTFSPSGLIIARGESRYIVTPHGIER